MIKATVKCPRCKESCSIEFHTNGKSGVQNEEYLIRCGYCEKTFMSKLEEVVLRTSNYIGDCK